MDARLRTLITPEQRDRVMAPIEDALTLPAAAYRDDVWFELEVERVFSRNWMGVLFECELAAPGSAQPFELFDRPLLAVKAPDDNVRVFHNICPYDGCPVIRHPVDGLHELTVYYHGWRYDLEGRLLEAPYWNGTPQCGPTELNGHDGNLVEVRSAVRQGIVFVDLGGNAGDIDTWLSPWHAVVDEHYAVRTLLPARDADARPLIEERSVAANWKTYQENASINILHESFTHESYRRSPEVPRVDEHGTPRFQLWTEGALVAFGYSRADTGQTYDEIGLPSAGHDPSVNPDYGFFTTLYPNVNIPLLDSMIKVNLVIPLGADRTRLKHLRFYHPEALDSPDFLTEEHAVQQLFDVVHYEDQLAIEAVQRTRSSPVWQQHFYAPFWDRLHYRFNQLVMMNMDTD